MIEKVAWDTPNGVQEALFTDIEIVGNFFHGTECNAHGIHHRASNCSGHQETVIRLDRIRSREPVEPLTEPSSPGV